VDLQRLLHRRLHVILAGVLAEHHVHGEGASRYGERGHVAEEGGKLGRVHRGGGHDQLQVMSAGHNLKRKGCLRLVMRFIEKYYRPFPKLRIIFKIKIIKQGI